MRSKNYESHNVYSRLYRIWKGIKRRCNNPNYNQYYLYGGRGIKICDEWMKYSAFREWAINNGYSDNLEIDRINVNGNYEPSNCRWVSNEEQQRNKRTNHFVEYGGEIMVLKDACKKANIDYRTVGYRIRRGWDDERALNTPKYKIQYNGKGTTYRELSRISGITASTIRRRILKGWSVEQAINTPPLH